MVGINITRRVDTELDQCGGGGGVGRQEWDARVSADEANDIADQVDDTLQLVRKGAAEIDWTIITFIEIKYWTTL